MFRTSSAVLLLVSALAAITHPGIASQSARNNEHKQAVAVTLIRDNPSSTHLNIKISEFTHDKVNIAGRVYDKFTIGDELTLSQDGYPDLPCLSRTVLIPPQSGVRLSTNLINSRIEEGISPLPASASGNLEGYKDAPEYLKHDGFWPPEPVVIGKPAIMRGCRVVNVTLFPFQYNRSTGQMRINEELDFELTYEGIGQNIVADPGRNVRSAMFNRVIGSMVENPPSPSRDDPVNGGSVVYVTGDWNSVVERLEPLLEWRRRMGWTAEIIRVDEAGDYDHVKAAVQDAYDEWDIPPEYVVICGQAQDPYMIGFWDARISGYYDYETDHVYGLLEGDDVLPEAAVGRLVFSSTQVLEGIVEKIIQYESDPYLGVNDDEGWQRRAAVASVDNRSGLSSVDACRWTRNLMLRHGFDEVSEFYWSPNDHQVDPTNFIGSNFDNGISFFMFRGWMSSIDRGALDNLRHPGMLPFAIIATCNTGDFYNHYWGYSEIERLLMNPDGGAIGAVGTSGATYTSYNNLMIAGSMRGILVEDITTQGWAMMRGKLDLFRNYEGRGDMPHPNDDELECWLASTYIFNLMGDPATDLYTDIPRELEVDHQETINCGQTRFEVHVAYADNEEDAADIQVCLYKPDEFQAVEQTDEDGVAVFNLDHEWVLDGEIQLTVTRHNLMPYLTDIEIVDAEMLIGVGAWDIGNEDNIAHPAEELDLVVEIVNYGEVQPDGELNLILTPADQHLEVIQGEAQFEIAPEPGEFGIVQFRVYIGGGFPDGEDAVFNLTATCGDEEWIGSISIPVEGPDLQFTEMVWAGEPLQPGEIAELLIYIENTGRVSSPHLDATLISLSHAVNVMIAGAEYEPMEPGGSERSDDIFRVSAPLYRIPGSTAEMALALEANDGFRDTTFFTINVGEPDDGDPFGPDNYGYSCFDSRDEDWFFAPGYNWIEIDPWRGRGVDTELSDTEEENDESVVVELPFDFTYYGEEFGRITICTNGWMAMGNQANLITGRNRRIPGGMVASGMICPYWNDLITTRDGGIYTYFDEEEHIFIVEWSKVRRLSPNGGQEPLLTFQAILYDSEFHPSYTGDGDIVFQYQDIDNSRQCFNWDTPYGTVGIGSPDQTDGLEYTYWNSYHPGATPLEDDLAIKFTTMLNISAFGFIGGQVTDAANGDPIEDVLITSNCGSWDRTDVNGEYLLRNVFADPDFAIDITARKEFWQTQVIEGLEVAEDETTEVNIEMLHPEFSLDPEWLHARILPDSGQTCTVTLSNSGNSPVHFKSRFLYIGNEFGAGSDPEASGSFIPPERDDPDEAWDPLLTWNVTEPTNSDRIPGGDYRITGITFVGDMWYISGSSNHGDTLNYFHIFDRNGEFIETIEQPIRERFGIRDMEYYEGYIYGVAATSARHIIKIDPEDGSEVDRWELPNRVSSAYCITINPSNGHFFAASIANDIFELELVEDELREVRSFRVVDPRDEEWVRRYGLAWFRDDRDGCPLYFTVDKDIENSPEIPDISIFKMNPQTEEIHYVTGLDDLDPSCRGRCGISITPKWHNSIWVFAAILDNPEGDIAALYELDFNANWVNYSPQSDIVDGDASLSICLEFNTADLDTGEYSVGIEFLHDAAPGITVLPVYLSVGYYGVGFEDDNLPHEYVLKQNYPNPFNPSTDICYSLRDACDVKLVVYDMLGREVAVLVNDQQSAGRYSIPFEGDDLSAGLYFYRLEAGNFRSVKKMVLVK